MVLETSARLPAAQTSDRLRIEFLFLDLTTCTRCLAADQALESALDVVREVLQATGVRVEVDKVLVESEERARALRLVSSPTIRVNGDDVALELRESSLADLPTPAASSGAASQQSSLALASQQDFCSAGGQQARSSADAALPEKKRARFSGSSYGSSADRARGHARP